MSLGLPVTLLVAADAMDGIARGQTLPWHLPADLVRFKRLTLGSGRSAVVMGRATWDTLPPRFRPLPGRLNLVLTRGTAAFPGATRVGSWQEVLRASAACEALWVLGGAQIYALALAQPEATAIELTRIAADCDCDVRWPGVPADFALVRREPHRAKGWSYAFERWERVSPGARRASAQMP